MQNWKNADSRVMVRLALAPSSLESWSAKL